MASRAWVAFAAITWQCRFWVWWEAGPPASPNAFPFNSRHEPNMECVVVILVKTSSAKSDTTLTSTGKVMLRSPARADVDR